MNRTKHEVEAGRGKGNRASVDHESYRALQLDFYIPAVIWKVRRVRSFFTALSRLGGATLFEQETGMWKGEKEKTHVFRVITFPGEVNLKQLRQTLREELGRLMVTLSASRKTAQEAMMYTETEITVAVARNVTRIE